MVLRARSGVGTLVLPGKREKTPELSNILLGAWDCYTSLLTLCRCNYRLVTELADKES